MEIKYLDDIIDEIILYRGYEMQTVSNWKMVCNLHAGKIQGKNGFKKYPHDRLGVGAVGQDVLGQSMARKENGWFSAGGIHLGKSRPEPVTSIGAGLRQQPLWDLAKASNFCWSR